MSKKSGFTLIEVLIVVFIIGLLASVVLVGLGAFRQRGRDARRVADLRSAQNALELYYAKNNQYPKVTGSGSQTWTDLKAALIGPEVGIGVESIPSDPIGGAASYEYASSDGTDADAPQSYVLKATLEEYNQILKEDIDDEVFGLQCGAEGDAEREYCIKF